MTILKKNIRWVIENAGSSELKEMGLRGHDYLVAHLTKDMSVEKYKETILGL